MHLSFDQFDGLSARNFMSTAWDDREDYSYGIERQRRLDREEADACNVEDKAEADRDETLIAEFEKMEAWND